LTYLDEAEENRLDWWSRYRAAWGFNHLDMPDSAAVLAGEALFLAAGNERCLGELLKALSSKPDSVLAFSTLVSGGGVCRYRLARAELDLGDFEGESVAWLLDTFENGDSVSAADAGCWLTILFPDKGIRYIERSVQLVPEESFYRCLLVDRLVDEGLLERAEEEFGLISDSAASGPGYWSTASSLYLAMGDDSAAVEASRTAYGMRRTPSSGANLGWLLYRYGESLISRNMMTGAVPVLYECTETWSPDSPWALRADSLLDDLNEFTSASDGFGEPL